MAEAAGSVYAMAELARMRAAGLKQRREADQDLDATLAVLAEELGGYSATVVRDACREWARTQIWWPSLAELRQSCEERARAAATYERPRLPPPAPLSHDAILERMRARYGWLDEWRLAGGGSMPSAVQRAHAGGPIIAVRFGPNGPWEPIGARQEAA